ncbi:hypothetical protein D3C72_2540580 [compost metagenome]
MTGVPAIRPLPAVTGTVSANLKPLPPIALLQAGEAAVGRVGGVVTGGVVPHWA